jgi:hypothetical protein
MKIVTTCLFILLANSAFSKDKIIDFKQKKGLKADEGLVLLMVDVNFRLGKVSLSKEGKLFPIYSFKKLRPGVQTKIIKLKIGKYYWKEGLGYSGKYKYTLDIDKELSLFEVKAGKINYPGTLILKAENDTSRNNSIFYSYNMINNSSAISSALENKYSDLLKKYPLVYSGKSPDPFLELKDELED